MDVISAFLNGTINEDILMEIPEGFPSAEDDTKVCQIKRALYGLKQSPKVWYDRINSWLQEQGFIRSECNSNMYLTNRNGKTTILLLYVDDLIITGNDTENIKNLKSKLHEDFEMTDLGAASHYLGIEIHRQENGIFIHQQGYIQKLLQKFNLEKCNSVKLPIDPSTILQKEMGTRKTDPAIYRSLVGSLLYLTHTRPDISYAVSYVSRFMQEPETAYFLAAKRFMRYLKGTSNYGTLFK